MNTALWRLLPLVILAAAFPAHAQTQDHVELGAGLLVMPVYQGADQIRLLPVPLIDVSSGPVFLSTTEGIGVRFGLGKVTFSASAIYLIGYRRRDTPDGTNRLSDALGSRLSAKAPIGQAILSASVTKAVAGGTGGLMGDASIAYPIKISRSLLVVPSVGVGWADRRHNARYFGYPDGKAPTGGLSRHQARPGLKDVSVTVVSRYALKDNIGLTATGSLTRLLPSVANAPLVEQRTSASGLLGVSYRF
jgi:outer membrane protein